MRRTCACLWRDARPLEGDGLPWVIRYPSRADERATGFTRRIAGVVRVGSDVLDPRTPILVSVIVVLVACRPAAPPSAMPPPAMPPPETHSSAGTADLGARPMDPVEGAELDAIGRTLFFDATIRSVPTGAVVYALDDDDSFEHLGETPTIVRTSLVDLPTTIYVRLDGYVVQPVVIDGAVPVHVVQLRPGKTEY